jgi:hypothetical protein
MSSGLEQYLSKKVREENPDYERLMASDPKKI